MLSFVSARRFAVVTALALLTSQSVAGQARAGGPGLAGRGGYALPELPAVFATFDQYVRVSVVARGLDRPWSLLMLPDGDMLVSMRFANEIRAIRDGVLDPTPLGGLPEMGRLFDIVTHPSFATNRLIYFDYVRPMGENTVLVLARGRYEGDRLSNVEELYVTGPANHFGIAPHPITGQMFHVELGPYGGDRVNILKAGGDYGWPDYGYGRNNDSSPLGNPHTPGIEPAFLIWVPGITPSGLLFYTGDAFPAWKDNLLVGSIVRGRTNGETGVERIVFNDNERMWEVRRETFLDELRQRIRDVRQGPDGLLYAITDEDDGALLRIEPAPL